MLDKKIRKKMSAKSVKERLIEEVAELPENKVKEVIDYVEYIKFKEDEWFIKYINERGRQAKSARRAGKKFVKIGDLQKEYNK